MQPKENRSHTQDDTRGDGLGVKKRGKKRGTSRRSRRRGEDDRYLPCTDRWSVDQAASAHTSHDGRTADACDFMFSAAKRGKTEKRASFIQRAHTAAMNGVAWIAARLRQYSARAVGARAGDRLRVARRRNRVRTER